MAEDSGGACIRRRHSRWTTCRCEPCTVVRRRVQKQRNVGILAPARNEEAWATVQRLIAAGWTPTAIATGAGLHPRTVLHAIRRQRTTGVYSTWSYGHAEALIALDASTVPVGGFVAVFGARRRLRALACLGWSVAAISTHIAARPDLTPVGESTLGAIRAGRTDSGIRPQFDRSIRAIYESLSMRTAPGGKSATRTRNGARENGWLPPLAFDDHDLDDRRHVVERRARRAAAAC